MRPLHLILAIGASRAVVHSTLINPPKVRGAPSDSLQCNESFPSIFTSPLQHLKSAARKPDPPICPEDQTDCGDICWNPKIERCCFQDSYTCPEDWDCVQGGCCPRDHKPCGTIGCYDPDVYVCCLEARVVCDKYAERCASSGCCGLLDPACQDSATSSIASTTATGRTSTRNTGTGDLKTSTASVPTIETASSTSNSQGAEPSANSATPWLVKGSDLIFRGIGYGLTYMGMWFAVAVFLFFLL
ncbi:hypothetical protein BCR34DRAFT_368436 [Clohesyomyces aquaticus]|uniref:Uncharacterized protein n=1 Tax=Clohesyomyces aquaticus TaxID=1231657 RepID=A0A1Y1ZHD4_9PLEO|nr:hypothetical protein BCR34DRAFT_368436 [Clohesyomyces aquaticus]